jgi:nickel-dependent lactate racemase
MALIDLPFDGGTLSFEINDANLAEVLSPKPSRPIADLDTAIAAALDSPIGQEPLQKWVKPGDKVLIISDDNTRLTPADRMIPPMLDRLNQAGVQDGDIRCIMALGTHRYMTDDEMIDKVGQAVFQRIEVINHLWREEANLADLGTSHGTPLQVNKAVTEADVVIGLGAVVPHHIPGYSGSSKIIQPGISGPKTTAETHLLSTESGGDSFLGIEENVVREDMDDMATRCGMKTIFNVVMNSEGEVIDLFYGEMKAAFKKAVELSRQIYGVPYHQTPDIVVTNAYPCELDFWQSHKSQYPAQRMVKPGGTIIICTRRSEGSQPGAYRPAGFHGLVIPADIKTAYREGRDQKRGGQPHWPPPGPWCARKRQ